MIFLAYLTRMNVDALLSSLNKRRKSQETTINPGAQRIIGWHRADITSYTLRAALPMKHQQVGL